MPKLSKLRLVSVGHSRARFNDLTLDFRNDNTGHVDDSIIWLENQGGKSSTLALFYALIRPHRSEFMAGGTTHRKERRIEDYVLETDRGVVIAEWELDGRDPSADDPDSPPRYLTGVFYEWPKGNKNDPRGLQRLFFAARVIESEPQLTLEGIPVYEFQSDGRKYRRSMVNFKQEWNDLGIRMVNAQMKETENQSTWADVLREAKIDPELFGYQLAMNQREGGAEDLFKFKSPEAFVDFFLELIFTEEAGEKVTEAFETFKKNQKRRSEQLIPEQGLLQRLVDLLRGFIQVKNAHEQLQQKLRTVSWKISSLQAQLRQRSEELTQISKAEAFREDQARSNAGKAREGADRFLRLAATVRVIALQQEKRRLEEQKKQDKLHLADARRTRAIWELAPPLKNALMFEEEAKGHLNLMNAEKGENAPLFNELTKAAAAYASALLADKESLNNQQVQYAGEVAQAREEARRCHEKASDLRVEKAALDQKADDISKRLAELAQARQRLEKCNAVDADELIEQASERLGRKAEELRTKETVIEEAAQALLRDILSVQATLCDVVREQSGESCAKDTVYEQLKNARSERTSLEQDSQLLQILEVEKFDIFQVKVVLQNHLKKVIDICQDRLIRTRAKLDELWRSIGYVNEKGLLPPEDEVEKLLEYLNKAGIAAWNGWHYTSGLVKTVEQPAFVEQAPEVARGIVVRDEFFDRATAVLNKAAIDVRYPVVVVARDSIQREIIPRRIIVGPGSTGLFNPAVAQKEKLDLEQQAAFESETLQELAYTLFNYHKKLHQLEFFFKHYSESWFAARSELLEQQTNKVENYVKEKALLDDKLQQDVDELKKLAAAYETVNLERIDALVKKAIVDENTEIFKKEIPLQKEYEQFNTDSTALVVRIEELTGQAEEAEKQALAVEKEVGRVSQSIADLNQKISSVQYCDLEKVISLKGNTDALNGEYQRLYQHYQSKSVQSSNALYRSAMQHHQKARRDFDDLLLSSADDNISEEEVRNAIHEVSGAHELNERIRNAKSACESALGVFHKSESQEAGIAEKIQSKLSDCVKYGGIDTAIDYGSISLEQAEEIAKEFEQIYVHFASVSSDYNGEVSKALENKITADQRASVLSQAITRINDLRMPTQVEGTLDLIDQYNFESVSNKEFAVWITKILSQYKEVEEDIGEAASERRNSFKEINAWLTNSRFQMLKLQYLNKFRSTDGLDYGADAEGDLDALALRLQTLNDELNDTDTWKNQIIEVLCHEADKGIIALKEAVRHSKLPAQLKALAGQHFLKITTQEPTDPGAKRDRIGEMVDNMLQTGEVKKSIYSVQEAVRRVARTIHVSLLFPNSERQSERIAVERLGSISGGERLTCSVLLYCTLVKSRAWQAGIRENISSTLLLDNPIGTSSKVRLLVIQREVAQSMGVQLIYATGVNDFKALRTFPTILRLRNGRLDQRTGHMMVELEQKETIEAAKLVLPNKSTDQSQDEDGIGN